MNQKIRNSFWGALCLLLLLITGNLHTQPGNQIHFMIVKLGDEAANNQTASEYLNIISDYFRSKVPGWQDKEMHGWIANQPDSAMWIFESTRPVFAYVPASFYIEFLHTSGKTVTPIVQAVRFEKAVDRFYLVTTKEGPAVLSGLHKKTIKSTFGLPHGFLKKLVFPPDFQPGQHFSLQSSDNLADDMFLMLEAANNAPAVPEKPPAALLLDDEFKHFFETDEFTWQDVKVIWSSPPLPRELFVTIGEWREKDTHALKSALLSMKDDPQGADLLNLMNSSGFVEVNNELLNQTLRKYAASK